jgi:ankyrin repeat protein
MNESALRDLFEQIKVGDIEAVQRYTDSGGNVNAIEEISLMTPLKIAIEFDNIDIVGFLLRNGADPNLTSIGLTPLGQAVDLRGVIFRDDPDDYDTRIMELLLGYGADPNLKGINNRSAIDVANVIAEADNFSLILDLLKNFPRK